MAQAASKAGAVLLPGAMGLQKARGREVLVVCKKKGDCKRVG